MTVKGKSILTMDEFKNGESYIAVGGEGKIDRENLSQHLVTQAPIQEVQQTQQPIAPAEAVEHIDTKIQTEPTSKSPSSPTVSSPTRKAVVEKKWQGEVFGTQVDKAFVIYVFRNGDKHHSGEKLVVQPKKIKTFDQLLQACNVVGIPTG
ncbi:dcx, partial [Acrasis kona]